MGQRLVVTIEKGEKSLAKIYYHWGAYTYSALFQTKNIIDCIYNHDDETEKELQLRLIRFCEESGGGITSNKEYSEHKYIQSTFPNETFKTDDYSRNNGLIAISEMGMNGLQGWSEGDVYINLDTDKVDFCVYCGYESLEGYIEERKSWDDDFNEKEMENIPTFDFCLGCFEVTDIDAIIASLDTTNAHIIKCNGEICEMIE